MVLDHEEKLCLPDERIGEYYNSLLTLRYLVVGLEYLYGLVLPIEKRLHRQVGNTTKLFAYDHDPELYWVPKDVLCCAFHWYCLSACNYARLVGWISKRAGIWTLAKDYVRAVIPRLLDYRHKIAAHPAKICPRKEDSAADRDASVLYPVHFRFDGRLHAAPGRLATIRNGESSTSRNLDWSLTRTHEDLIPRWWPNRPDFFLPEELFRQ